MGRELERRLPKGGLIKATSFTHTSVHAHDLDESVRFYKELFGMEEIPAPDFPFPVRWLRLGDLQLHLFQSEDLAPKGHHFGVDVDDFEATYVKVGKMDVREKEGYFSYLYEIPDGAVQMYLRDPAGNMVEVNWPDASTLDRSVVTEEIHKIEAETAESAKATLYL
jgi:catechol 2,3-dioxygenase-like lactoylglutathione lyase family enzyme